MFTVEGSQRERVTQFVAFQSMFSVSEKLLDLSFETKR